MSNPPTFDDGIDTKDDLTPLNSRKINDSELASAVAVAIQSIEGKNVPPRITAAGRGKIAEQILQLAFDAGINVREDKDLVEILAKIELDSPIPSEAFMAVAEVLSYVFKANGEPEPFNAILEDFLQHERDAQQDTKHKAHESE